MWMVAVGGALGAMDCSDNDGQPALDATVDSASPDAEIDADLSQFDFPVKVLQIIDGDTLVVQHHGVSVHIRVAGINCPEVSPEPEPYGLEAEEFTRYNAPSLSWVGLEFDDPACGAENPPAACLDYYDRLLAYIRTQDGDDLGYLLLANGLAQVYMQADFDRKPEYIEAEDYAKNLGVGIWSQ
jgi:endonuclease YncB( thermonuclease family)